MHDQKIAWTPDPVTIESANLTAFMRTVRVRDYDELLSRADAEPAWFFGEWLRYLDYRFYRPYQRVLDDSGGAPWLRWCPGGTTNVVLNALDRWRGTPTYDKPALVWEGEDGAKRSYTYRDLDREVCRFAGALRSLGLARGDVIALFMPNVPEAVVALLAIPKIGAIAMPLFSGFGGDAVQARLELGGAKAIVTVDGSSRRGKLVDTKATVDQAAAHTPELRYVIVSQRTGNRIQWVNGRDHWWHELCASQSPEAHTEEMHADAPFLLVFTSGTTGRPKGVVHGHTGFPVKIVLDLALCMDFKPQDRFLWMSDMGWVIGPFTVYTTFVIGGTLLLAEGAPNSPDPDRMWRLVADHKISYLGVAPTTVRTFMAQGREPWRSFDLSSLRDDLERRTLDARRMAMVVRTRRQWPRAAAQLLRRH